LAPEQLQTEAWQVHDPEVLHVRLHVFPWHVQTLESLQVRLQLPFVDWHCAVQVSDPLQVRLQGPGWAALQLSIFGPMLISPHPAIHSSAKTKALETFQDFMRASCLMGSLEPSCDCQLGRKQALCHCGTHSFRQSASAL
jgi:hypothetical protein